MPILDRLRRRAIEELLALPSKAGRAVHGGLQLLVKQPTKHVAKMPPKVSWTYPIAASGFAYGLGHTAKQSFYEVSDRIDKYIDDGIFLKAIRGTVNTVSSAKDKAYDWTVGWFIPSTKSAQKATELGFLKNLGDSCADYIPKVGATLALWHYGSGLYARQSRKHNVRELARKLSALPPGDPNLLNVAADHIYDLEVEPRIESPSQRRQTRNVSVLCRRYFGKDLDDLVDRIFDEGRVPEPARTNAAIDGHRRYVALEAVKRHNEILNGSDAYSAVLAAAGITLPNIEAELQARIPNNFHQHTTSRNIIEEAADEARKELLAVHPRMHYATFAAAGAGYLALRNFFNLEGADWITQAYGTGLAAAFAGRWGSKEHRTQALVNKRLGKAVVPYKELPEYLADLHRRFTASPTGAAISDFVSRNRSKLAKGALALALAGGLAVGGYQAAKKVNQPKLTQQSLDAPQADISGLVQGLPHIDYKAIILDPGHVGEENPGAAAPHTLLQGASGNYVVESQLTWNISDYLKQVIRKASPNTLVFLTAKPGENKTLDKKISEAGELLQDFSPAEIALLSIHVNSGEGQGAEAFYSTSNTRRTLSEAASDFRKTFSTQNQKERAQESFSEPILYELDKLGLKNRGVSKDGTGANLGELGILRRLDPEYKAAVVEVGFINNKNDLNILRTKPYHVAVAMYRGLALDNIIAQQLGTYQPVK